MERKVRIGLVDDHPIVVEGLTGLLGNATNYEIVGTASSVAEGTRLCELSELDVLITDLHMPGNVEEMISEVLRKNDKTRILIFTSSERVEDCQMALDKGASGYIVKGSSRAELFRAIDTLVRGEQHVSAAITMRLIEQMTTQRRRVVEELLPDLSLREEQVISYLVRGASNRSIAEKLFLSEKTVKFYMTQIMQKLNAKNRLEVIVEISRIRARAPHFLASILGKSGPPPESKGLSK